MIDASKIIGVVLAGGQSRRMEGPDKVFVELAGTPMVARAVERLKQQTQTVVINSNKPEADFASVIDTSNHPVFADTLGGYKGPLAGVLAGLRHAQTHFPEANHIVTIATDTPFFPADLVARLASAVSETAQIALAASDGHRHPVFGLWPVALADDLENWLTTSDTMKVMAWVKPKGYEEVAFEFKDGHDPFFNINTPDDLQKAEALLTETT